MSSPEAPRILIVRLSAIGDVLHGLPVLNALRAHWPDAFLAWMIEGRTADLLERHPALDWLVRVPRGWLKRFSTASDAARRLRRLECDTAIDLQGLTKSALAARISGARRRIGFAGRDGRELSPWLNNELVKPTATHVIDRNLELLRPLGIEAPPVTFDLPEMPDESANAAAMLDRLFAPSRSIAGMGGPRFAMINPGAGWPSKRWPAERFAAVARWLGEARGLPSLVVWSGASERQLADEIIAGSRGNARLAEPTTLRQLAALARRAAIVVSSDTGPLHLAVAVGTPAVGLFGPMPAERNGPYGPAHRAIQRATVAGGSRQRRMANNAAMLAIAVDDVLAACDDVLSNLPGQRNCA